MLLAFKTTKHGYHVYKHGEHEHPQIINQSDDDYEEDEDEEDVIGEEEELQEPPRKMTKIIRGKKKKYLFLKTLKSMEELDKFRFKVIMPQMSM
jgi:hypothetical protein